MISTSKVTARQLMLMLILIIPGGKYLSLPAIVARELGRDSYFAFIFLFLLDLVLLTVILLAVRANTNRLNVYQILSQTLSKVVAKAIFLIFAVLFICRTSVLLVNCVDMFSSTFSVKTNWLGYILPICAVIIFCMRKGVNSFARLAEILFIFILLALLAIVVFSFKQADLNNLKPMLEQGLGKVIKTSFNYSFWFSDAIFILFFMDFLPEKKVKVAPFYLAFFVGAVICIGLDILFVALFDTLSPYNGLAMSKVSQFTIPLSSLGRLDWLGLVIWLTSIYIKSIILIFCAYRCVNFVFGANELKFNWFSTIITLIPIIIAPIFIDIKEEVYAIFCIGAGKYFFWFVQYILPLFLPLLTYISNKKQKRCNLSKSTTLQKRKYTTKIIGLS
ncbi:MAG: GerAB/ArcD/ProY family transporter [Clostridia bacterium]